ncbi:hypothetical protein NCCP2222_31970 [Sporosarcina sp. NCCP-2222]|nr:hypothetical protein NCCP2222_31970 [Sporosarcina sp. NCCP-2222]
MQEHITEIENNKFSGAVLVKDNQGIRAEMSYGYANRSEQLENTFSTRFGIASGCKLFTAIAICQLVEKGALSFDTTLADCLDADFPNFDKDITIHHLLNHIWNDVRKFCPNIRPNHGADEHLQQQLGIQQTFRRVANSSSDVISRSAYEV